MNPANDERQRLLFSYSFFGFARTKIESYVRRLLKNDEEKSAWAAQRYGLASPWIFDSNACAQLTPHNMNAGQRAALNAALGILYVVGETT